MSQLAILIPLLWAPAGRPIPTDSLVVEDAQVTLIAEVRVPALEEGVLAQLRVAEGDLVEAGAELGRLNDDLAAMDQKVATLELDISTIRSENDVDRRFAKKSWEVAQSELTRAVSSVEAFPNSVSRTELDRLGLVAEKSRLSIEQSDRDLEVAELNKTLKQQAVRVSTKRLERRRIAAPIGGMVVQIFRKPGEWVNPGDPVARIIQMDRLRVEAFVDGRKHGAELRDCPVRLSAQLPPGDQTAHFNGHIVFVSPELHPVNGQVRVWAEVENPELRLRPGTRGELTIRALREESSPSPPVRE